jgi:hypothetical protein
MAAPSSSSVITLTVTDSGGLTASRSFLVTLQADPFTGWLSRYFSAAQLADPSVSGDNADPDHDGATNREEFLAGTDPTDLASVLKATARTAPVVSWSSVTNTTYRVLRSPSLESPNWTALNPLVTATNSTSMFIDLEAPGQAYYRVEVVPQ